MTPPSCPLTGRHIRWLLLAAFLSYFIYFLVHGISDPPSSRAVHICDTGNEFEEMIQCDSLEDYTTCAELTDADGNVATCIESSCGYQLFPHIDVSIAGSSDPFDPDGATSAATFASIMMIFYSLVPYLVGFVFLVEFLAFGNLVPLTRLLVLGVISITNEVIFKNLLKQHRPEGSCLYFLSFGMPSGHAASSIGLLTYLLLEQSVYHPNIICGITCQKREQQNGYSFKWGYGWQKQSDHDQPQSMSEATYNVAADSVAIDIDSGADEENTASPDPLLDNSQESDTQSYAPSVLGKLIHHLYALGYFVLLFPVPFSRVYLHDHFFAQVLYGSLIGIAAATVWYLGLVRNCGMRIIEWRTSEWGKWWGLKLGWEEGFF